MKKDDALNILTAMQKSYLSLGIPDPEAVETLDMAINAVKAEPCEDSISRQAAIYAIYKMHMNGKEGVLHDLKTKIGSDAHFAETIADAVETLEDLPSVNPVKTGHWIRQDNTKEPLYGWYFCSECNSVIGDKTKFCSNCGAKMEDSE